MPGGIRRAAIQNRIVHAKSRSVRRSIERVPIGLEKKSEKFSVQDDVAVALSTMECVIVILLIVAFISTGFIVIAAPWMAVRGPWVKYDVNIDRIPNDADTAEMYRQYPMLMFERQQYPSEMCFSRMSTPLFKLVFNLKPRVECHYDNDDYDVRIRVGYRTRRHRCYVWYCLSKWTVLTNNRTLFSHHVSVSNGHQYNLLVADACWFLWWAPAIVLLCLSSSMKSNCLLIIGVVYISVAFAARVALSILAMLEFYKYDALTDPPHGQYVQNSTFLGQFTTRTYSWGYVCGWIVIGGNGLFILTLIISLIYFGIVGKEKFSANWGHAKTRVSSIRKTSFRRKSSQLTAVDVAATTSALEPKDEEPVNAEREGYGEEPEAESCLRSAGNEEWQSPPAYDTVANYDTASNRS